MLRTVYMLSNHFHFLITAMKYEEINAKSKKSTNGQNKKNIGEVWRGLQEKSVINSTHTVIVN